VSVLDDRLADAAVQSVMARLNRSVAIATGVSAEEYDATVVPSTDAVVTALAPLATPPVDLAALVAPLVSEGLAQALDMAGRVAFAQANPELAELVGLGGVSPERLARLGAAAAATPVAYAPLNVAAAVAEVVALF
jgi:hypothetical protein